MEEIKVDEITYYGIRFPLGSISVVFHLKIEIIVENDLMDEELDKLPGERHDPDKDYSPKYKIVNEEMLEWLTENVKQTYKTNMTHFYFDNQEDVMAFKLRWI